MNKLQIIIFIILLIVIMALSILKYKEVPSLNHSEKQIANVAKDDKLELTANMIAVVAFAFTGVLAIYTPDVDIFGAIVLGVITALGGGTIRDAIMDVPIFWIKMPMYVWVSTVASLFAFYTARYLSHSQIFDFIVYMDGLGAAMFGIQGAHKAWNKFPNNSTFAIIMGVITAIGGGLIRDILSGKKTLIMSHDLYAVPVLFGCSLYVYLLKYAPVQYSNLSSILCTMFVFLFRAASIHWSLTVPKMFIGNHARLSIV